MNISEIEQFIKKRIKGQAGDDERQHAAEDELYQEVLQAISLGAENAAELAAAALEAQKIPFFRWFA